MCEERDGKASIAENRPGEISIPIYNQGLTPVKVTLSFQPHINGAAIVSPSYLEVRTSYPSHIKIKTPPIDFQGRQVLSLGTLTLEAQDNPAVDPWLPIETRTRRLTVQVTLVKRKPAIISFLEEIAIFRGKVSERILTLVNEGDEPAEVILVDPAPGYEITRETTTPFVSRDFPMLFKVTRNWAEQTEAVTPFMVHLKSGETHKVDLLTSNVQQRGFVYMGVVGVDFGTTFTTITFRQCYHTDNYTDDPVQFLLPPGETNPRFPTLAWIDKSTNELFFSTQAREKYREDPAAGFLIREFKTLLRSTADVKISPDGFRDQGIQTLRNHLGENWGQELVILYLEWLNNQCIRPALQKYLGRGADVRYVFSIPVLDFNLEDQTQYRQQSQLMRTCIARAGFPLYEEKSRNRVDIEFEPVCALIGLLHPPSDVEVDSEGGQQGRNRWPKLNTPGYPLSNDDMVGIYDSGGGTTDVVLAQSRIGNDSRVSLRPLSCLGVDSKTETFGGEWVTDAVLEALTHPQTRMLDDNQRFDQSWYQGPEPDFTNVFKTEDYGYRKLNREEAERVKFELTNEKPVPFVTARGPGAIAKRLLALLVLPELKALAEKLKAVVFKENETDRSRVKYYLFVGGNTRIPFLRQWIERFMGDQNGNRRLMLPDKYQQLAISYGAVWVPDARVRNSVPYDVEVTINAEQVIFLPRHQTQDVINQTFVYQMGPSDQLDVRVRGTFPEFTAPLTLAAKRQRNPTGTSCMFQIGVSLHEGQIEVQYRLYKPGPNNTPADNKPLVEYQL